MILLTGKIPLIDGRSLRDAGVPIVSICCEMPDLPTVLVTDEECAIAQTQHLIELGHRHLLYVSGPEGHYNEIVRYRGFLKATRASHAAGVDVPGEVSVVGFDEFADYCEPTLTTIRQPRWDLGVAGARALLSLLRVPPRASENPIVLPGSS